jgi:hypothetical protein
LLGRRPGKTISLPSQAKFERGQAYILGKISEPDPLTFASYRQRDIRHIWNVDSASDGKKIYYGNIVDSLAQVLDAAQFGCSVPMKKGARVTENGARPTEKGARQTRICARTREAARRRSPEGRAASVLFNLIRKY